jgi:serine/threonine protein kinase
MPSDRWEKISRLYDAAIELAETERPSFLDQACGEDAELRREVESLLGYDQRARQFMDRSALQITAEKLAAEPVSLLGRKLGPYQIQVLLGSGGMGEVYRARDTRLNRTVAIKVLPRHLLEKSDLRQRFEREARAIASLDHPHICALYDVGHEGATEFLVMQYLDGETLSQRLKKGPLPTDDVLRDSIEIASALDKAHRQGLIHRDLKPGNIMLTETGAKLLDFGLAKQNRPPLTKGDFGAVESATKSESLTEQGMILGTLEYMAPEQLEGREADARTDIFALGVVIYEMAAGCKAFEGDSKASVIAKILTEQPPPIGTIQPVSPPELDRVVRRCLAKKPEERWQSAAELTSQLREIVESNLETLKAQKRGREETREAKELEPKAAVPAAIPEPPKVLSTLISSRAWKFSFVGILLVIITGSLALWRLRQRPEKLLEQPKEISAKPLTSYSMNTPLDSPAISPDGKYLAFCSKGKLSIQIIRSGEKRSIPLPEWFYTAAVSWFPDTTKLLLTRAEERWIQVKGKTTLQTDTSLWSISILGGTPQKLVDRALYPSVSPDGSLVAFNRFDPERETHDIWVVGANGEMPRRIKSPSQPNQSYYGPVWSSNGQRLFYLRDYNKTQWLESCDLLGEQVTNIFPSKTGQERFYDWEGILSFCWDRDGRILFAMKEKGLFAANLWEIKVDAATGRPLSQARRFTEWTSFSTVNVGDMSITADGKQLAVLRSNLQTDVYVAELEPGGKAMKNPRRLTLVESIDAAWDWTADSRAVLFVSDRNGTPDIFKQDISGTDAETIVASPEQEGRPALSPDGAFILYLVSEKPSPYATRLMRIPVGGGPPELVLSGEKLGTFSCAREAKLCVVAEGVEGEQTLTAFDPVKGRGEKLSLSSYPVFAYGILSHQGRLIDKMKAGPDGLYVHVSSLTGGPAQEITFKNLTGHYRFKGWSLDGKGIYIDHWIPSGFESLYAGLDGHSQVLWSRGSTLGWWFDNPIPSPDGRHLAFTLGTNESNAWMLENF